MSSVLQSITSSSGNDVTCQSQGGEASTLATGSPTWDALKTPMGSKSGSCTETETPETKQLKSTLPQDSIHTEALESHSRNDTPDEASGAKSIMASSLPAQSEVCVKTDFVENDHETIIEHEHNPREKVPVSAPGSKKRKRPESEDAGGTQIIDRARKVPVPSQVSGETEIIVRNAPEGPKKSHRAAILEQMFTILHYEKVGDYTYFRNLEHWVENHQETSLDGHIPWEKCLGSSGELYETQPPAKISQSVMAKIVSGGYDGKVCWNKKRRVMIRNPTREAWEKDIKELGYYEQWGDWSDNDDGDGS